MLPTLLPGTMASLIETLVPARSGPITVQTAFASELFAVVAVRLTEAGTVVGPALPVAPSAKVYVPGMPPASRYLQSFSLALLLIIVTIVCFDASPAATPATTVAVGRSAAGPASGPRVTSTPAELSAVICET